MFLFVIGAEWEDLIGAIVTGNFFAEDKDGLVTGHLLLHGEIESVTDSHLYVGGQVGCKRGFPRRTVWSFSEVA